MYFDDFIAQRTMTANDPSPRSAAPQLPLRRLLHALWTGVRQVVWGIDAFSRVRHGIEVPADHGARRRPRSGEGSDRR